MSNLILLYAKVIHFTVKNSWENWKNSVTVTFSRATKSWVFTCRSWLVLWYGWRCVFRTLSSIYNTIEPSPWTVLKKTPQKTQLHCRYFLSTSLGKIIKMHYSIIKSDIMRRGLGPLPKLIRCKISMQRLSAHPRHQKWENLKFL